MQQYGRSRGKRLLLRIVLALVAGLVWWLANRHAHAAASPVRTISVHARKFEFVPSEITLKQGEPARLVFISDDVPHALAVEGLAIHAEVVKGHPVSLMVIPAEAGDFPGKCTKFCGTGHRDMHLVIHVAP